MSDVIVRRRKDTQKWEYRLELASVNGKRKQKSKSGFKTKAEALREGRKALDEYEKSGQVIVLSEISVSDMLDAWLEEMRKNELKQVTADGYAKKIRLYIKPYIGQYKAKLISRKTLQELINDLGDRGFSKNTVSSVRGILTSSFDWAEMNKMIAQSPAWKLKTPKHTKVRQRTDPHIFIKKEEMEKIFKRFPEGTTSHIPMMIAYHCGLRLGEVYGLTWEDIDFESKLLSVNRQVQWNPDKTRTKEEKKEANGSTAKGNGYWYFSAPKYNSFRVIDMDNSLIELLQREKDRQNKAALYYDNRYTRYYSFDPLTEINLDSTDLEIKIGIEKTENEISFVCRRENGEYITPRTMQHTSSVIHKQLEMPEFDFHSIRHTHATMLRDYGAPDIYVQHRLGHVKVETTKYIYQNHLTAISVKQGNNALSSLF
jgi:integrase